MEKVYGSLIAEKLIDQQLAQNLWDAGFQTTDSLLELPTNARELQTLLQIDCPSLQRIGIAFSLVAAIKRLQIGKAPTNSAANSEKRSTEVSSSKPSEPSSLTSEKYAPVPAPREHNKVPVANDNNLELGTHINEDRKQDVAPTESVGEIEIQPITMPVIDHQCHVGQLYNSNTGQFLSQIYWSDAEITQNLTTEELSSRPLISAHNLTTVSGRLDALGLAGDINLRLNVLFGLASCSDAAKKLFNLNCNAINSDCYCIRFASRTERKIVERMTFDRAYDNATHVVTGIVFGIDQYFVFTEKSGTSSSSLISRIERLIAALNADPVSTRSLDYPLSEEEPETCCDCFGDDNSRSMNMFDAYFELKRYRNGRKKVANQPKAVILRPLTINQFIDVSQEFAGRTERFYDRFEEMKGNILSVLNVESSVLPNILLSSIKSSLSEMNHKLNGFFIDILGQHRERKRHEAELLKELQQFEGAFNEEAIKQITLYMNEYCNNIRDAISPVKEAGIQINPEDFDKHRPALVLTINVHTLEAAVSQSIFNLIVNEHDRRSIQEKVPVDFHDNLPHSINAFINFYQSNGAKTFFACCTTSSAEANLISVQYFRNESDPEETVSIPSPVRADTIQATSISPTSIQLQWKALNPTEESLTGGHGNHSNTLLTGYRITIINVAEQSTDFRISQQKCEEYLVIGLIENTAYAFQIQPLCRDGLTMEDCLPSRPFKTTEPERLAHRVLKTASLITSDPIPTYRLKRKTILQDKKHDFSQYTIGKESSGQLGEKLLLLTGGTGSGKSTLVNSIVNFLYDVRAEDKFRLKLISDEDEFKESNTNHAGSSKTKRISAYQLNGTKLPYRLTIVDTPGFGDTEGLDKDKETVYYMKQWFDTGAMGEQKLIDAVCLVMKSSETRVTPQVKHELTSVIGLFGRDMEQNILTLFTFSDGSDVPALAALKTEDIPVNAYFKFNNSAFFLDLNGGDKMHNIFWRRANESYEAFFSEFDMLQPRSLALSLYGLRLREDVERQARLLTDRVREEIELLHNMTQLFQVVDQYRMQIAKNTHFKTLQKVRQRREVKLPEGVLATTCNQCNYTCHTKCNVKDNGALYWCSTMNIVLPPTEKQLKTGGKGLDGVFKYTYLPTPAQEEAQRRDAQCTVCAPKCHWTKHVNRNYRIVFEDVMREITDENILRQYKIAVNEANKTEKLVEQMTNKFIAMEQQLSNTVADIRKLLNKLDEIALRPGHMTDVEYIKMMIETEEAEMNDGYQHRLEVLRRHLSTMEMIARANRGDNLLEQQVENDAFEFLRTRFPDLYANISNARHFRAQQPSTAAKPRGLYPSLDVLV